MRSCRAASRARTRSRAAYSAPVGTRTGTISSSRNNRARCIASRASSPGHKPGAAASMAQPLRNAIPPPSARGPSRTRSARPRRSPQTVPAAPRPTTAPRYARASNPARNTSPVCPSIAAAMTERAWKSSPTLVRSLNTGVSSQVWTGRAPASARQATRQRERGSGQQPPTQTANGHYIRSKPVAERAQPPAGQRSAIPPGA
jgi:hypothetical protein